MARGEAETGNYMHKYKDDYFICRYLCGHVHLHMRIWEIRQAFNLGIVRSVSKAQLTGQRVDRIIGQQLQNHSWEVLRQLCNSPDLWHSAFWDLGKTLRFQGGGDPHKIFDSLANWAPGPSSH